MATEFKTFKEILDLLAKHGVEVFTKNGQYDINEFDYEDFFSEYTRKELAQGRSYIEIHGETRLDGQTVWGITYAGHPYLDNPILSKRAYVATVKEIYKFLEHLIGDEDIAELTNEAVTS